MKLRFNANFLRASVSLALVAMALLVSPARAQSTLYWSGGTTNITDGTPVVTNWSGLNGTWGGATKNWATDTNGTTYSAWVDGNSINVFSAGYDNTNSPAQDITNTMISDMSVGGIAWQFYVPTAATT